MPATTQNDFSARLMRIRDQNGQTVMMVGQDEQYVIARKQIVQVSRRREIAGNLVYPASLLGAILLGMIAVATSHYVRFQLMAGSAALSDPDMEMLMVGGIGIAASFVLSQAFRLTSKEHRSLQGIGVFLMVCTFHNLCHWLPGPMALAFSPAYVVTITDTSPRNSFQFRGTYFPLFDTAADGSASTAILDALSDPAADPVQDKAKLPIVRKGGKIVQGG